MPALSIYQLTVLAPIFLFRTFEDASNKVTEALKNLRSSIGFRAPFSNILETSRVERQKRVPVKARRVRGNNWTRWSYITQHFNFCISNYKKYLRKQKISSNINLNRFQKGIKMRQNTLFRVWATHGKNAKNLQFKKYFHGKKAKIFPQNVIFVASKEPVDNFLLHIEKNMYLGQINLWTKKLDDK